MQMTLLNSNFELFQTLIACETEADVITALKSAGYWDKPDAWRLYGDRENNFSIIGNQQASPVSALIEKFVNSVDAVLIRECLRKGINPEASSAPQSIEKALEEISQNNCILYDAKAVDACLKLFVEKDFEFK